MTHENARNVLEAIERSQLGDLRQQMLEAAVRYAGLRAAWALAAPDARTAMDADRTAAHNAFIDSCNIMSRNMAKHGEDNRWRAALGDDRKTIGDLACHLHALLGIRAR